MNEPPSNFPALLAAINLWGSIGVVIVIFLIFLNFSLFQSLDGSTSSIMGIKKGYLWLVVLAIDLLCLSGAYSNYRSNRNLHKTTQNQVIFIGVTSALTNYHNSFGAWPENLDKLITNSKNIRFLDSPTPVLDAWDRRILFSTNSTTTNAVQLRSLGADGKPGGTGADSDIEVIVRVP